MDKDTAKKKLSAEKEKIEKLMQGFAKKHPHEGEDYDVVAPPFDDKADIEDQAEFTEEFNTLEATKDELAARLTVIDGALAKLTNGGYGICERCKKPISEARLAVNPAARYCVECLKK